MGTSMSVHRHYDTSGDGSSELSLHTLVEREVQVEVGPEEILYVPVDVGFGKFEIRTVYAENSENNPTILRIFDKRQNGYAIYQSIEEVSTYDILNIPCQDKDFNNSCHLYIENRSVTPTVYKIVMRFTNLY